MHVILIVWRVEITLGLRWKTKRKKVANHKG